MVRGSRSLLATWSSIRNIHSWATAFSNLVSGVGGSVLEFGCSVIPLWTASNRECRGATSCWSTRRRQGSLPRWNSRRHSIPWSFSLGDWHERKKIVLTFLLKFKADSTYVVRASDIVCCHMKPLDKHDYNEECQRSSSKPLKSEVSAAHPGDHKLIVVLLRAVRTQTIVQ